MNYIVSAIGVVVLLSSLQAGHAWAALIGLLMLACGPLGFKDHVMRLRRDGTMISDPSGWTVTAFGDRYWVACFREDWRRRYPTTWAVGIGRTHVWWYEPRRKGEDYGERRTDHHD